ncbi:MAG: hypothetical protein O7I42_18750 [Alphaproteobacteria bacterium]|nr:hypothetical protein [Alphaproteobacteria bacterium]
MRLDDQKMDYSYEEADVALYDPNLRMRTLMRGMLMTIGFRSIIEVRNTEEVVNTINLLPADLLIVDLDYEPDQICGVVRDIREGLVGTNPYIVIVGLTWKPEKEMISRSLQTGFDDLIAKPISPKILSDRTTNLINNRKEFVVTTSYLGPERRRIERQIKGDLDTIKVPNSLRHKATGDKSAIADTQALDTMEHIVNTHRIYRLAKEICRECRKLERQFAVSKFGRGLSWNYRELTYKINAINKLVTIESIEVLVQISESMQAVIESMDAADQTTAQHFSILRLHGEAISEAIKDERAAAHLIANALLQTMEIKRSCKASPAKQSAA